MNKVLVIFFDDITDSQIEAISDEISEVVNTAGIAAVQFVGTPLIAKELLVGEEDEDG